ncbi:MAG: lysine biosynthesis protein LysW [Nitrososphaerota archaeon]|nr:lysine biosynthesis protein LysW [Nitrososphaerota archaeon]MDG7035932.1 lysine biosynthesis protein LysW [Nitrososphaerota archaeon]MDG7038892.1 lysine biosynthesis protein LysW [Nitrososphaerota archaeon]MDG7039711.1 lysine biosynthesis protein LysW [Nitrososphaerota archaeon]MDG7042605.1 lysine biosynthesis protein LysW [Nitrososphaerota archaeon]
MNCQECGAEMDIPADSIPGEIISCPDCGVEYEIVSISADKVEVKPAEEVGEDWGE